MVQEWWGLNPQMKRVTDRLAAAGFVALAPDLYRGELAAHEERDKARCLMDGLSREQAGRDMGRAVDHLLAHPSRNGTGIGVVGYCLGGELCFLLGSERPDAIRAVVPCYGFIVFDAPDVPDWRQLTAPIQGHFAEHDDYYPAPQVEALASALRGGGASVELHVYPGTRHAFANDDDPVGTFDAGATALAWDRTVAFLHRHLT